MHDSERQRLDADYSPSRLVPSIETYLSAYHNDSQQVADRYRQSGQLHESLVFGTRPREKLHLITPQARHPATPPTAVTNGTLAPTPLVVFIHGGFWKALSADASLYPAPSWVERDVGFAAIGYTLAPEASLSQIVAECYAGLSWLVENASQFGIDSDRIVLCGHSAGAHLAAMCLCRDWADWRPAGAVLVGGVFDLAPISRCYVNDTLSLTAGEIDALSPVRHRPIAEVPVSLVYGENETEAFKQQSHALAQSWRRYTGVVRCEESANYNHFDLIQQLGNDEHVIYTDIASFLD